MTAPHGGIDMMHEHPFLADGGPRAEYEIVFRRQGVYRVWVQFQSAGVVNTMAFRRSRGFGTPGPVEFVDTVPLTAAQIVKLSDQVSHTMESYMKVSRILIVALLSASCSDDRQPPPTAFEAAEQQTATTGEAVETQAPAAKKPAPASTPIADAATAAGVNPDAAVLQDFKARVDAYLKLRKDAIKGAPRLKETTDAAQIKGAQDAMAALIQAARSTAKHGDVFTPEITAKFRRLLSPELKGDEGRDAKAIIKDDAPTNVTFKVNAKYPDGAPVPTVPANLLLSLPQLPEPLQYRIIDKHLILLDEDADVIVDYALNVIR